MENDLDPFVRNEVPNNGGYYRKKNSCKKIIIFVEILSKNLFAIFLFFLQNFYKLINSCG